MDNWRSLADIRRDYGLLSLDEQHIHADPFEQFKLWFQDVLNVETSDPTAMVLSTVDAQGRPDSRIVLLKGIEEQAFVFYTNYHSTKALQLKHTPYAALNFHWPQLARQIRIRGKVKRTSKAQSDSYFASRPLSSQLSALASPQSSEIANREVLEQSFNQLIDQYKDSPVIRPRHWGGYQVIAEEIEFWQGRDNRLHDRVQYVKHRGRWQYRRLAP